MAMATDTAFAVGVLALVGRLPQAWLGRADADTSPLLVDLTM
jgi:hypothetical protein